MRSAIQHAHMKKAPVISAADYMQPVSNTLQHAHVKHAQINLNNNDDEFNMFSCLASKTTTTALTFHSFEDNGAQSGLKRHARSNKKDVFFKTDKEPADKTKTC